MTEEVVDFPVTAPMLLAAILSQIDSVTLTVDQLMSDYSDYQLSVTEDEQGRYTFGLVRGDVATA
jgi:hypothetical protein